MRLGDPRADDERVHRAAALAGADDFIRALPGAMTRWSARADARSPPESSSGSHLRAFLRDAPLVLLDEPTANLDSESAEIVADAVERLRADRTVLLAVHQPELAARADRVVRLAAGRIVEPAAEAA